jgi:hypothetical protein
MGNSEVTEIIAWLESSNESMRASRQEKDKRTPGDKALDQLLELANTFEAWSIDDTTLQEGIDWRDAAHKARQAADAVARATANWKKKNRASE